MNEDLDPVIHQNKGFYSVVHVGSELGSRQFFNCTFKDCQFRACDPGSCEFVDCQFIACDRAPESESYCEAILDLLMHPSF